MGNPVPISHTLGPPPPGYLAAEPLPGPVLPPHHPALVPPIHEGQPLPLTAPSSMLGPPLISQEMPPAADESAIGTQRPPIVPPPPDIQPIIDKLAKYVAKNGEEFEASVRDKHDPRFEFLVPWHNYNAYYLAKKDMFLQEFRQREEGADAADAENRNAAEKQKKVPVRFPIKPKRAEERTLERRSALPLESSSDSEEEGEGDESTSGSHRRTTARAGDFPAGAQRGFPPEMQRGFPPELQRGFPPRQQMDWPMEEGRVGGGGEGREWTAMGQEGGMDPSYIRAMEAQGRLGVQQFMGEEDATQSRRCGSAYSEDQGNGSEGRFADDGRESTRTAGSQPRLEDRLAAAARKKLASASQERSLQVERRKKLALFLNQVKDRPQAAAAAQESGVTDSERDEFERGRLLGRPRSPQVSNRGEQAQSAGVSRSAMYGDSRGGKRVPPVPKSYQTAVNRGVVERRRKRRSRSRSPSPRRSRKMSPAPISTIVPSTSAIMGRAR
ncbi:uncharacterized protein [Diadema antillarum]|uniref:uncharacterized protein n=1 Tax=Diadema antillarum TaxID=105358 RepID=UPI003A8871B2